ncbi:MAG TPA: N,N-dimethylformamidase beta subunit family domain-containing protein, partial [Gemmatimonadaceae bacterium]
MRKTTSTVRVRSSRGLRVIALSGFFALAASLLVAITPTAPAEASSGSSCGANINPVVCENSKPGTAPNIWDIDGAGDADIQGFATDISVDVGSTIKFKIDTSASAYKIDIYRTGYYQGLGARYIASVIPSATLPQKQPQCISDANTELYDCGNWAVSASWNVPSDAISGVYVAKLTRTDNGDASHIIFIVRNDASHSDIVFQTSDPTWEAYNTYGGADFYQGGANNRAYKISYNRPFATRGVYAGRDFYFSGEFATMQFLEQNGYDVSYMAGLDTDRYGSLLRNHSVFLSVGHDEYWSAAQRANVTAARDAGVNLTFFSGNEVYWHTRYEASSADGTSTPYRTLVSYKETWGNTANPQGGKIDTSTSEWTGTWRDPRFATAANGGSKPENAVSGTMYMANSDDLPVTVTSAQGKTRLWRNTSLTSLAAGSTQALADHTVG